MPNDSDNRLSRRSVLKTTGSLGAAVTGLGAVGTASAASEIDVGFIMTESFTNAVADPYDEGRAIRDRVVEEWDDNINYDGERPMNDWFEGRYTVPEDELRDDNSLAGRMTDADQWMQDNVHSYSGRDAWLVLDYYGKQGQDGRIAEGPDGTAGESSGYSGIVDHYFDYNDALPYIYRYLDSGSLGVRSVFETCSAQAPDHAAEKAWSYWGPYYTLMYKRDGVECAVRDNDADNVLESVSDCTEEVVREHVGNL